MVFDAKAFDSMFGSWSDTLHAVCRPANGANSRTCHKPEMQKCPTGWTVPLALVDPSAKLGKQLTHHAKGRTSAVTLARSEETLDGLGGGGICAMRVRTMDKPQQVAPFDSNAVLTERRIAPTPLPVLLAALHVGGALGESDVHFDAPWRGR